MSLALRLGRTLGELVETIDTYELSLWREVDRLSPIGDERGDYLNASLAATVAQAAGAKVKPTDMLLRWGASDPVVSPVTAGESALKAFLLSQIGKKKTAS